MDLVNKDTPEEWNRNTRETFIKAKYVDKKYVNFKEFESDLNENLIQAIKEKNIEKALKLIVLGAEPHFKDKSNDELTPLHYSVLGEDIGMCQFLLEQSSVDVNAIDINCWAPLHYASKVKNASITALLFKRRADLNKKTKEGIKQKNNFPTSINSSHFPKDLHPLILHLKIGLLTVSLY